MDCSSLNDNVWAMFASLSKNVISGNGDRGKIKRCIFPWKLVCFLLVWFLFDLMSWSHKNIARTAVLDCKFKSEHVIQFGLMSRTQEPNDYEMEEILSFWIKCFTLEQSENWEKLWASRKFQRVCLQNHFPSKCLFQFTTKFFSVLPLNWCHDLSQICQL